MRSKQSLWFFACVGMLFCLVLGSGIPFAVGGGKDKKGGPEKNGKEEIREYYETGRSHESEEMKDDSDTIESDTSDSDTTETERVGAGGEASGKTGGKASGTKRKRGDQGPEHQKKSQRASKVAKSKIPTADTAAGSSSSSHTSSSTSSSSSSSAPTPYNALNFLAAADTKGWSRDFLSFFTEAELMVHQAVNQSLSNSVCNYFDNVYEGKAFELPETVTSGGDSGSPTISRSVELALNKQRSYKQTVLLLEMIYGFVEAFSWRDDPENLTTFLHPESKKKGATGSMAPDSWERRIHLLRAFEWLKKYQGRFGKGRLAGLLTNELIKWSSNSGTKDLSNVTGLVKIRRAYQRMCKDYPAAREIVAALHVFGLGTKPDLKEAQRQVEAIQTALQIKGLSTTKTSWMKMGKVLNFLKLSEKHGNSLSRNLIDKGRLADGTFAEPSADTLNDLEALQQTNLATLSLAGGATELLLKRKYYSRALSFAVIIIW